MQLGENRAQQKFEFCATAKTIFNKDLKHTIVKSLSRQSKQIYYLLYLDLQGNRYQIRKLKRSANIIANVSTSQ